MPGQWNVTALGGTFSSGHALLADLNGPRLGVRWKRVPREKVTGAFLQEVVRGEAGESAVVEVAGDSAVYLDQSVPGRDVYVAWFAESGRLLELVYHAQERDDVLMTQLVPGLKDVSSLAEQPWSVLDLSCTVPAGFELRSHNLRAGDLQLHWSQGRRFVSVRQIAMAAAMLGRTTLDALLGQQQDLIHYRAEGPTEDEAILTSDGREHVGKCGLARRRRRFFWQAGLAPQRVTLALHDAARDRVVIVEADDPALARQVAGTVGGGGC